MTKKIIYFFVAFVSLSLKAQLITDFETINSNITISGDQSAIVDNPNKTGNNSLKACYYKKVAGNWKNITFAFTTKLNTNKSDRFIFKINSSTAGRVYVKIWNDNVVLIEGWSPTYDFMPAAGTWTDASIDISSVQNKDFNKIEISASVDNTAAADVYFDDLRLYNSLSPNGNPVINLTISSNQVVVGNAISFDASNSYDDGSIVSFDWDFNDGNVGSGSKISHTFLSDGVFNVTLKVKDTENQISTKQVLIYVLLVNQKISKISFLNNSPKTFEKIEAGFVTNTQYVNPNDPDEVKIDAIITLPDNNKLTVPCFYYVKGVYAANWKTDSTSKYWLLRFSSSQVGVHKINLTLTDKNGTITSAEYSITVSTGLKKGYITVDSQNKQYYRHSTGEPYLPIGINNAWNSIENYNAIIKNLAAGNANFMRYWHTAFYKMTLEWKKGSDFYKGLGIYSQEAAAEHDSIINLCEANGINAQMVLFHHGMFSENVNSNWSDSPYNSINGGPLLKAEEYFYNSDAKLRTKKLLRYIVARWGYSPNIFAWELFNEVNYTGVNGSQSNTWKSSVITWHDEMGKYIKSIDAFKHIVTTSSADDSQLPSLDKNLGLDVVQYHLYTPDLLNAQTAKDKGFLNSLTRTSIINGEYGLDVNTADVPFDFQRISIWTGIMNRVPHIMWLWNNYTKPEWSNLFKYAGEFLNNKDFVKEGNISDWALNAKNSSYIFGANGFKTSENYYAVIYDNAGGNNITDVVIDLSSIKSGRYKVSYLNTLDGSSIIKDSVIIIGTHKLPPFSKAVVVSFKYQADVGPLAIDPQIIRNGAKVYPNPGFGDFTILFDDARSASVQIAIVNAQGKLVFTKNSAFQNDKLFLKKDEINVSPGIYFLKLSLNNKILINKIMID